MNPKYAVILLLLSASFILGWKNPSGRNERNQSRNNLESGFLNPPPQARPHTFWIWMNGNITREGITADLEAMARVGIGGVLIFNVAGSHGTDIPAGPIDYLSEEWLDLVKYTASEAELRLNGKELDILWSKSFRVEVGEALLYGSNKLEIDVTNLWVNRLIGDEQYPDDCDWAEGNYLNRWPEWLNNDGQRTLFSRVTFTTWKHWKKDDPLSTSGLIGPVTLRAARLVPVQSANN